MTLAISPALQRPVFTMLPLLTTHEHQSAATSMREAITIEYIVLLMTDSHPAALKVLHQSLIGISIVAHGSSIRVGPESTRTGRCAHDSFSNPFPCIHPPLSTCGGAQRSSWLLKLEATFCLRFLQGGVETILTRKELS